MKMNVLQRNLMLFCIVFSMSMFAQSLPVASLTDAVGDVSETWIDYTQCYFVQEGESLFVGYTMDGLLSERIPGYSTNTFFTDVDDDLSTGQSGSRVGSENNFTFCDLGDGTWYGNFYVNWDSDPSFNAFKNHVVLPVKIHDDGKTMYCKISLVGTGWEELVYDLNGWYKDGSSWHQVPHLPGDMMDEVGLCEIDVSKVTNLVVKEGSNCIVNVPEPYSSAADLKNITDVVDEMVDLVRSMIGYISENTRKYIVGYENFTDYSHPIYYSTARPNQFGCRIPGQFWVDTPDWFAMLDGVVNMTINELSAGCREIFLTNSYYRPIPGSNEGWYCTEEDSINGFKWAFVHKMTIKALLGTAVENCYNFYIAENMTGGEAKTAIESLKSDFITEWSNFTGTAEDLTPELITGLLLSLTDDLSWTETLFEEVIPTEFDTADSTNKFTQVVNNYVRHEDFQIRSSDDFLTQAHHGWYGVITAVQTAAIEWAMGEDLLSVLEGITNFPIDSEVYTESKKLLNPAEDPYVADDTVPYVWNDISTIGTELLREEFTAPWASPDVDDGSAGPIALGIAFEFYGETFDSIYVGINGQCSFTDHIDWITSGSYGTTIPGMGWDNILCPLACDIMGDKAYSSAPYNTATGTIYYYTDAGENTFTVQYHNMTNHHYVVDEVCPDTNLTFQVVLDADDGSIIYYYKNLGISPEPCAKRATIGIQPGKDSGLGCQYYGGNEPTDGYPESESAIKFYIPNVAIDDVSENLPVEFTLAQNFPNPFNPVTNISFVLPKRAGVSMVVYDMLGQRVATLMSNQVVESGPHTIQWNASNLPSGIYFYRMEIEGQRSITKKCVLVK